MTSFLGKPGLLGWRHLLGGFKYFSQLYNLRCRLIIETWINKSSLHCDHTNAKFDHIGGETCLERLVVALKGMLRGGISYVISSHGGSLLARKIQMRNNEVPGENFGVHNLNVILETTLIGNHQPQMRYLQGK
jgi:hypothetical protein